MDAATLQMTLSSPLSSAAKAATDTFHCRDYLPTCARPPLRLLFLDNRHLHRHHHSFFLFTTSVVCPFAFSLSGFGLSASVHSLFIIHCKREKEIKKERMMTFGELSSSHLHSLTYDSLTFSTGAL